MTKRKSTTVANEMQEMSKKFDELKVLHEKAKNEENERLERVKEEIHAIAKQNDMFCGLIITRNDLLNMMKIMLETGDPTINVEFRVYYNE